MISVPLLEEVFASADDLMRFGLEQRCPGRRRTMALFKPAYSGSTNHKPISLSKIQISFNLLQTVNFMSL